MVFWQNPAAKKTVQPFDDMLMLATFYQTTITTLKQLKQTTNFL